jgi:DNA-binding FadR family transcriptional regulator
MHVGRRQEVLQREYWDPRDPEVLRACVASGPERTLLAETIDARTVVEEAAARLAVEHATDADLDQLAARIAEMDRALEPGAARTFNERDPLVVAEAWFHHTLALLSGNAQLAKLAEPGGRARGRRGGDVRAAAAAVDEAALVTVTRLARRPPRRSRSRRRSARRRPRRASHRCRRS